MAFFRRAAKRPRRNPDALEQFKLGRGFAAAGRRAEAVDCYLRALDLDPAFAEAVVNLGILYAQMGPEHAEEHLACLRRGAELNPGSARAHYNLGVALARRGDAGDEALREFETALTIEPGHKNALYALSVQWNRRGDRARAEAYHRQYSGLDPLAAAPLAMPPVPEVPRAEPVLPEPLSSAPGSAPAPVAPLLRLRFVR